MPNLELATQVATIISALTSAAQLGISYNRAVSGIDQKQIARQAKTLVSTYDDEELDSLKERLEKCRRRFITEGDGRQRVRCLCSVLEDAIDGNGGTAPIDDWQDTYDQLCR
ncbi:MAG: hypothetical protein ACPGYV_00780 [Phycisphaeraceae bacterium]